MQNIILHHDCAGPHTNVGSMVKIHYLKNEMNVDEIHVYYSFNIKIFEYNMARNFNIKISVYLLFELNSCNKLFSDRSWTRVKIPFSEVYIKIKLDRRPFLRTILNLIVFACTLE